MKPTNAPRLLLPLLLPVLVLVACSRQSPPAADVSNPASPSRYVAIARGWVDVEGGLVVVRAQHDGMVVAVHAEEGDSVKQGQLLLELGSQQAQVAVDLARAEMAQAQAHAQEAVAQLPQAVLHAQRLTAAATEGAASGESRDEARASLAQLRAAAAAAQAATAAAKQRLAAAELELSARSIRAPVAGTILHRSVQIGDAVSAQAATELMQLLPARPRIVRAELDEAFVDHIHPGMAAEVLSDTDAAQVYKAHVLRVGEAFGASRITDDPAARTDLRSVPCVLALDDANTRLRIGQRVLTRFLPSDTK